MSQLQDKTQRQPQSERASSTSATASSQLDGFIITEADAVMRAGPTSTVTEQAEALMREWEELRHTAGIPPPKEGGPLWPQYLIELWPLDQITTYWDTHGSKCYPQLSKVFMSVSAMVAAAAEIERDYGVAGKLMAPSRSSIDPEYTEMVCLIREFLGGKTAVVPDDLLPELKQPIKEDDIEAAIPERLRLAADDDLDSDVEDDEADDVFSSVLYEERRALARRQAEREAERKRRRQAEASESNERRVRPRIQGSDDDSGDDSREARWFRRYREQAEGRRNAQRDALSGDT